jgi:hypothetical protein
LVDRTQRLTVRCADVPRGIRGLGCVPRASRGLGCVLRASRGLGCVPRESRGLGCVPRGSRGLGCVLRPLAPPCALLARARARVGRCKKCINC